MGALGAAAGAFEGDNAREEQRARRAGLGLQEAALAQRDRQFSEGMAFDREKMAADEREDAAMRQERVNDASVRQSNADRDFGLQEKQFQAGQEKDLYQRGRDEIKDAWGQAIDEQTLLEKQERIRTNRLQFEELDRASKMEREQLANRQRLAKTGLGALALSAARNGGVAYNDAIALFNKKQEAAGTGIKVTSGKWTPEGFAFKRVGPAVDQNGNPVQGQMMEYDEMMPSAIANPLLKDEFGEDMSRSQEKEAQNAFTLKRDKGQADAEMGRVKASLETKSNSYSEKRHEGLLMRKGELESELESEKDPEKKKAIARKIDVVKSTIDSILLGDGAQEAPSASDYITIRAPDGSIGKVKKGSEQKYLSKTGFSIVK